MLAAGGKRVSEVAFLCLLLAVCSWCGRLWAESLGERPAPRVLLVTDRPSDPFMERVGAELKELGFSVVALLVRQQAEPTETLEAAARSHAAVAAIRMLPTRKGVEVWMADETSGRSLLRQVVVDESRGGPNEGLVALQTAELLRTSLLSEHRPSSETPPTPAASPVSAQSSVPSSTTAATKPRSHPNRSEPATVPTSKPSGEVNMAVAIGVFHSPGGADDALQLWFSIERSMGPRIGLALEASVPVHRATLSGPEGTARVGTYLVGLTLLGHLESRAPGFFAAWGPGAAVVYIAAEGSTQAPLRTASASAFSGAAFLRLDAGFKPTGWLRFGARAVAGAALDRVLLQFAGNDAGSWGRPFVAGLGLIDMRWP